MLSYEETMQRLLAVHNTLGMKFGLKNSLLLSEALDFPEKSFKSVHVAGTNGKGSVTTKIAKALEFSGYKVGIYTSPHLVSFTERIVINGIEISEEEVTSCMNEIFSIVEDLKISATFFEMTTLLAFEYFRKNKVDVAVIETGLGGELDTTNIITPLLSVITSISHDHTSLLGNTLEEIAQAKAGIIKQNVPVVVGNKARYASIYQRAKELNSALFEVDEVKGFYDLENSAIAKCALEQLSSHFDLNDNAIEKGLKIRPPCRFEKVGPAILDVAHNPDGFLRLFDALDYHYPNKSYRFVLGMSQDKDLKMCLKLLSIKASHIHLVEASTNRAAGLKELQSILESQAYKDFSANKSIASTMEDACQKAYANDEVLVVCGSFFIMEEVKASLSLERPVGIKA